MLSNQKGFTLLEILLAVAAIAILAGIVIVAINPGKQLADTRNAQRKVDVKTILNAVYQYATDNRGTLPASLSTAPVEICKTGAASCAGLVDLSALTPTYVVAIPVDPASVSANGSGYYIATSTGNRLIITAPGAERGQVISAAN